jgi:hypothetical protein
MEESDLAPDIYSPLEVGLRSLLKLLPEEQLENALTFQYRLTQNITDARQTGETDQLKAERAKILVQLNRLALANVGKSFNDLTPTLVSPKPEENTPTQAKGVTEDSPAEQASFLPLLFPALGADFNYFLYVSLGLTLFSCYFFGAPFLLKAFTPPNPTPLLLVSPRPTVGESLPSATVPPVLPTAAPPTTAPPASPITEATNPPPNPPTFTATLLPPATFTATPLPSNTPTFTVTPSPAPSPYPAPASPTFTPTETPVPPTNTSSTNPYPHSSG